MGGRRPPPARKAGVPPAGTSVRRAQRAIYACIYIAVVVKLLLLQKTCIVLSQISSNKDGIMYYLQGLNIVTRMLIVYY